MPDSSQTRRLAIALGALSLSILFWSSVPLLLRVFARTLDAWTVNGLRYLFAALFWLPFVLRYRREVPPGRNVWIDALPAAAAHLAGQVLFGFTPYYNSATVINFVSRSSFLFTTLFSLSFLPEERPIARRPLFWIGFLGTAVGLSTMYRGGTGTTSTSAIGMGILLSTSCLWGLYSVLVRRRLSGYPSPLSFGVVSLYAAPGLIALMFGMGNWRAALHMGAGMWVLIWISAVAGIALGHVLYYQSIHRLGPITSEGSLVLIPFITALLASAILGERFLYLEWIGGLILVLGCVSLVLAKAQASRHPVVSETTD